MIDIHTHILPGLDDGAVSIDDTLEMARAAYSEGITTIVATPHHANGSYTNTKSTVVQHTDLVNERLRAEGVPIRVMTGQEIRVHDDLLDAWGRNELLSLAESKYVLLEMPSSSIPKSMEELIHELNIMKLKPIIAHPERNAEVLKHPERLAKLIELGAFAQVTSHSLLGGFGKRVEQSAWHLMKQGSIHIVSSDAHNLERRGFRLSEAYISIERTMGEQWVSFLQENARKVVEDEAMNEQQPSVSLSSDVVRQFFSRIFKR